MKDYDLSQLNDKEFESISIDLLSRHAGKRIERIRTAKGKGIDGRFFTFGNYRTVIQVKHWAKYGLDALALHLKNNALENIKILNPSRYILATSIELSSHNKRALKNILSPYVKSDSDIYGRKDLIKLIYNNENIYKNYYKLQLSCTATLKALLNSAITGRGSFVFEEIIEASRKYVPTNHHKNALDILKELHAVIITGESGTGKTTLADHLCRHYAISDFELCYIEESISEGEDSFSNNKKQVFYFDDFLGRNYLRVQSRHEDTRLIDFIHRVGKDNSKRFIATSRTGILDNSVHLYGLFGADNFNRKEYELDITSLTGLDKARILYNHIWFSELDEAYIDDIYINTRYREIIDHDNFNPGLISFITDANKISYIPPGRYWYFLTDTLEFPVNAWSHVFNNQLNDHSRIIASLVAFNGREITEKQLRESFLSFVNAQKHKTSFYGISDFDVSIKLAAGAIIKREIKPNTGHVVYDLFNPAAGDYIIGFYAKHFDLIYRYFESLTTTASLHNLESLQSTNLIETDLLRNALTRIFNSTIINSASDKCLNYKLHLAHLYTTTPDLDDAGKNSIIDLLGSVNPSELTQNNASIISALFSWCLSQGLMDDIKVVLLDFIDSILNEPLDHEDYISISKLLHATGDEVNTTLSRKLKTQIIEYWQRQIHSHATETGNLDDYMHEADAGKAREALVHDIDTLLSRYEINFSRSNIDLICEYCDIEQIIEDNLERASWDECTYDEEIYIKQPSADADSAINDLFDRN